MAAHSCGHIYLRCSKCAENKICPGFGSIQLHDLEAVVYQQVVKTLGDYKTLTGRKKKRAASPKLTAKQRELAQVGSEIKKLLDTLAGATPVLISYANAKIEELDSRCQALTNEIAKLTAEAVSPEQIDTLSNYLNDWENVRCEDKQ